MLFNQWYWDLFVQWCDSRAHYQNSLTSCRRVSNNIRADRSVDAINSLKSHQINRNSPQTDKVACDSNSTLSLLLIKRYIVLYFETIYTPAFKCGNGRVRSMRVDLPFFVDFRLFIILFLRVFALYIWVGTWTVAKITPDVQYTSILKKFGNADVEDSTPTKYDITFHLYFAQFITRYKLHVLQKEYWQFSINTDATYFRRYLPSVSECEIFIFQLVVA